jgi:hypothetical protein
MIRSRARLRRFLEPLLAALAVAIAGARSQAQTATNITGIYNTGLASNGSLAAGGAQASDWSVSYASINGGTSSSSTYEGAAYVISPASVSASGYTANTSNAQWIVAPGASTAATGGTLNSGGNYLPGNGNTGSKEGVYIYTLAFTITGSGTAGTLVTSQIQVSMTLAADDQYSVYVNPTGNGTKIPTGTAASSQTSAWSNTTGLVLQNYGSGGANNATFKIGTNYIVVVVDNTNGVTGASTSTTLNESGLLVFESSAAEINGKPVPEVATWLPLLGVIGCYGLVVFRRRNGRLEPIGA